MLHATHPLSSAFFHCPAACPRTIRRYFGVTVEVLDTFPYSPVGAVAWGVHSDKNTNPLWVTERYAVDPVLHPHNVCGVRVCVHELINICINLFVPRATQTHSALGTGMQCTMEEVAGVSKRVAFSLILGGQGGFNLP